MRIQLIQGHRLKRQFVISNGYNIVLNTPAPIGPPERCLNGAVPVGSCNNFTPCPSGSNCTLGFVCCPTFSNEVTLPTFSGGVCPNSGQSAVAQCINGQCNYGYQCINNFCCGIGSSVLPNVFNNIQNYGNCPQGYVAVGTCINGLCPNGGFSQGSCVGNTCCTYSPLPPFGTCPPGVPTLANLCE